MVKKSKNKKKKSGTNHLKDFRVVEIDQEALKNIVLSSNVDDQYDRIYKLLNAEDVEDENNAVVNHENLEKYLAYLKKEITLPIVVTGIEDMGCFGWEEFYNFGPGSKKEYEKLKKKYPSFRNEYELLSFNEDFDDEEGLYVEHRFSRRTYHIRCKRLWNNPAKNKACDFSNFQQLSGL